MEIHNAEYVKSFTKVGSIDLPPLPAFAFIGRSNVGKSTLINHLTQRNKLVKTSGTPGKTQLINFFLIDQAYYLVDLPGYGFATAPKAVKEQWMLMIWDFLFQYEPLKMIFQILDLRHDPSKEDREFNMSLVEGGLPYRLIGNKADKLNKSQVQQQASKLRKTLGASEPLILHSALKKMGRTELLEAIEALL
ncbi:MAG: ribosome biogenesis GTP-binding protein YihA/YsxC [bacterium]|nr:ribosome biogenesis GTP-binding protein YihA/YsxC [bacterium]